LVFARFLKIVTVGANRKDWRQQAFQFLRGIVETSDEVFFNKGIGAPQDLRNVIEK
jgi:hypothetical protein